VVGEGFEAGGGDVAFVSRDHFVVDLDQEGADESDY